VQRVRDGGWVHARYWRKFLAAVTRRHTNHTTLQTAAGSFRDIDHLQQTVDKLEEHYRFLDLTNGHTIYDPDLRDAIWAAIWAKEYIAGATMAQAGIREQHRKVVLLATPKTDVPAWWPRDKNRKPLPVQVCGDGSGWQLNIDYAYAVLPEDVKALKELWVTTFERRAWAYKTLPMPRKSSQQRRKGK